MLTRKPWRIGVGRNFVAAAARWPSRSSRRGHLIMKMYGSCSACLLALAFARLAPAATTNWNNNIGGSFTTAANWTDSINPLLHAVPGAGDTAVFDVNLNIQYNVTFPGRPIPSPFTREVRQLKVGTNTVSFADSVNINQLPASFVVDASNALGAYGVVVGETASQVAVLNTTLHSFSTSGVTIGSVAGSHGTLNVAGGTFSVTGSLDGSFYDEFVVGSAGNGILNVSSGAHLDMGGSLADAKIGDLQISSGKVTVTGLGSMWTIGRYLNIGYRGTGTLNVTAGGQVSDVSATISPTAAATIADAGSKWSNDILYVEGPLSIQNGGQVTNISTQIDASGTATVDGTGSTLANNAFLAVGRDFAGTLNVRNGAQVSSNSAYLGLQTGSSGTATVDGTGGISTWNNSGTFYVGDKGTGVLIINHGAQVVNQLGFVGTESGSSGSVIVEGVGSTWANTEQLFVGLNGTGTLNVVGGGHVSNGTAYIGGSAGSVTVDGLGSTWTNNGNLYVGSTGTGTLNVRNSGDVSVTGLLSVAALGTVKGDGTITGNVQNGGTVAPGNSPAALHIHGDYTQTAVGNLRIELAGITPGTQFDQLLVSGTAALGGALNVSLLNAFSPVSGNSWRIIEAAGIIGSFSSITNGYLVQKQGNDLLLFFGAAPSLVGDYNGNGVVDAADYVGWRDTFGSTAMLIADGNTNNQIDIGDYQVWKSHFGQTAGSGAALAAVPEPVAMALALVGLLGLVMYRRGRRTNQC